MITVSLYSKDGKARLLFEIQDGYRIHGLKDRMKKKARKMGYACGEIVYKSESIRFKA